MSSMNEYELSCPECDHSQQVVVWDSINVDLDPSLRQELMDGEINMFKCESCGEEAFINKVLLYHDMTRKFCVQYLPEQMLGDVSNFEGYTPDGKLNIRLPDGTLALDYVSEPHIVFNMNEMIRYIVFLELLSGGETSRNGVSE